LRVRNDSILCGLTPYGAFACRKKEYCKLKRASFNCKSDNLTRRIAIDD
jgi:hypothetical protein